MADSSKYTTAVIFDLDGTLIDAFVTMCRNVQSVLRQFGVMVSDDDFVGLHRESPSALFRFAHSRVADQVSYPDFHSLFDEMYSRDNVDGTILNSMGFRYLQEEVDCGNSIVVLTNKRQGIAEQVCSTLLPDKVNAIIGRNGVEPLKNDFAAVKSLLQTEFSNLTFLRYYGDEDIDEQLANYLGLKFIKIH